MATQNRKICKEGKNHFTSWNSPHPSLGTDPRATGHGIGAMEKLEKLVQIRNLARVGCASESFGKKWRENAHWFNILSLEGADFINYFGIWSVPMNKALRGYLGQHIMRPGTYAHGTDFGWRGIGSKRAGAIKRD